MRCSQSVRHIIAWGMMDLQVVLTSAHGHEDTEKINRSNEDKTRNMNVIELGKGLPTM